MTARPLPLLLILTRTHQCKRKEQSATASLNSFVVVSADVVVMCISLAGVCVVMLLQIMRYSLLYLLSLRLCNYR